jgi:DNA-binding HxlR family transcriptional regulator
MASFNDNTDCPLTATLAMIGGRWKTVILYHLSFNTRRFGEIAVRIPAISRKVLTEQLKELELDGLIVREQFKEIPPRVEYSLTELGRSLSDVLKAMEVWGLAYAMKSETKGSGRALRSVVQQ